MYAIPGATTVIGRGEEGTYISNGDGSEARRRVRVQGREGRQAKQHAGGVHAFSDLPATAQTAGFSLKSRARECYGEVSSPFLKWVFSRKAKADDTKLAKKSAKHS